MKKNLMPWKRPKMEPFTSLQSAMNSLFDEFFESPEQMPAWRAGNWMPSVDVSEDQEAYIVTAELPGMTEKDVEVTLQDNVLSLRGEKKSEKEERKRDYYQQERCYGSFQRNIPFGIEIDPDKVMATFKKGVLHVNLPKNPKAKENGKKIDIKV